MERYHSEIFARLEGEHRYSRGERTGNWFLMWLFVSLPAVLVGIVEAHLRGFQLVRATPSLWAAVALGGIAGVLVIRAFNGTSYHVGREAFTCRTRWPRRSWSVSGREIEVAHVEYARHGHWTLTLQLTSGEKRKLVLTTSMRERLQL